MTKSEIILLALKQLKESYENNPVSLCFLTPDVANNQGFNTTILWKRVIELDGKVIQDPNNPAQAITISYNEYTRQISVDLYFKNVDATLLGRSITPDASMTFKYKYWPYLYQSFRIFNRLKRHLLNRSQNNQNIEFLTKLTAIFPAAGVNKLLD